MVVSLSVFAVPEGVASPMMIGVGSRELTISWQPPSRPNGVINEYNLLVGGVILSTVAGSSNSTLLAGLQPFTEYSLLLQACTRVGCTNSSMLVTQTLPDAPSGLAPPTLSVLSPSSISASWRLPNNTNGVISRIELRRLTTPTDFMVEFVDSNLTLATTVTGLLPNTNYSFQVVAFNAGGSVASEVSIATTLEDIPDQISPPVAMEIGPTHLLVSWVPPAVPNGEVILYNLTLDGRVIFSLMNGDLSYNVTRLRPFTTYSLAIIACTTRGCGSSIQSTFTTLEAMPQGYVQPVVTAVTPTTITLEIQSVASPNGQVLYIIRNIDGVGVAGVVFNSSSPAQVTVAGLQPFTNYSFELEVVNSAGSLAGPPFTIATVPTGRCRVKVEDERVHVLKHMRCRLRQNATDVSEIYIRRPIYISDVRYLYPTSDIPALALALAEVGYCISDVGYRYRASDIGTRMSHIGTRMSHIGTRMSHIGTRMSDIGTRMSDIGTRMSDIDIGRRIYILDVRYRFRKHWWRFVLNGTS